METDVDPPPPRPTSQFLRTPDAAIMLGLSPRTLEKHRTYGTGPTYRKLGFWAAQCATQGWSWPNRTFGAMVDPALARRMKAADLKPSPSAQRRNSSSRARIDVRVVASARKTADASLNMRVEKARAARLQPPDDGRAISQRAQGDVDAARSAAS